MAVTGISLSARNGRKNLKQQWSEPGSVVYCGVGGLILAGSENVVLLYLKIFEKASSSKDTYSSRAVLFAEISLVMFNDENDEANYDSHDFRQLLPRKARADNFLSLTLTVPKQSKTNFWYNSDEVCQSAIKAINIAFMINFITVKRLLMLWNWKTIRIEAHPLGIKITAPHIFGHIMFIYMKHKAVGANKMKMADDLNASLWL